MTKTVARITIGVLLASAFGGLALIYGVVSAVEVFLPPSFEVAIAPAPDITAKAWLVFDVERGEILYSLKADEQLPIASVTKLASAARFLEENDMAATATITWSDVAADGRAGKLGYGETYSNHELLFPLLLESSNDAASTMERVDPTLLERMNAYSKELSLTETSFSDASGLSNSNVSTARELMKLSRSIYRKHAHIFDVTVLREYYARDNGWINNSPFISDPAYRGGKHGFTYASNRTAVAFFEEQLEGGSSRVLGYVLLGSNDLARDVSELRSYVKQHTAFR